MADKCERCGWDKGIGTVQVLGGGGDYETWPCPICRPEEYKRILALSYGHDNYDGDGD